MYIIVENLLFLVISLEKDNIICANSSERYKIPYTLKIRFISFTIPERFNNNLLNIILSRLDKIKDQINFTTLSNDIFNNIKIKKLDARIDSFMNDKILQVKNCLNSKKYLWKNLISLNTFDNRNITDINFLTKTLKELNAGGYHCGINQAGIQNLQLVKLNTSNNKNITDVNFMKFTLKELRAVDHSGIDQAGIQNLQLVKLNISSNKKITDVNFLTMTLKELNASGYRCGVNQAGIQNLQLIKLNIFNNNNITDVNFMKFTLKELRPFRFIFKKF